MATALARPQSIALVVLVGGAALVWAGRARVTPSIAHMSPQAIPATVGSWVGAAVPIDERVFQILETRDVASMEYRLGQEPPVWLAQVAGFGNRAAFHPPEICYVGSHFEVFERGPLELVVHGRTRRVMRLVIGQGRDRFEAWYWFTANGRSTPNYYQQQWWLMTDALRGAPMSGTLVRISTTLDEPAAAHRRLLDFVTSWEQAASDGGPA